MNLTARQLQYIEDTIEHFIWDRCYSETKHKYITIELNKILDEVKKERQRLEQVHKDEN